MSITQHPRRSAPRHAGRSRMLAVVALAGVAALVAACSQPIGPGSTTAPPSPSTTMAGAAPVALDASELAASGLFDEVSANGAALRWVEPGASIAVIVGGSGGGGECIPQPHPAELDLGTPSIAVHFDPPNPEVMCTADFVLHGWQLDLAQPIDAGNVVPVQFVNLRGTDDVVDLRLGPDDTLLSPGADPQPSEIPDSGTVPEPEPIPTEQLPEEALAAANSNLLEVRWVEPGRSLAVLLAASGTTDCVPQPVGAAPTGPGTIEVTFERAASASCDGEATVHGWRVTLPAAVTATLPVEVTVRGALEGSVEVTLEPEDVLELP
ncbi:hypothetical protein [Agrococcus sp. ProA11]|uniref:hypothetical protein n=1 Tax=Agrococcus chionoecetis TaxID=3153752 RepID=UPI00326056BE